MPDWSEPTRKPLPLILIRGFGGLSVADERRLAYQGFNVGSVYPLKRGENYIYEGLIIRLMKSGWQFHDATNVVGFYPTAPEPPRELREELRHLPPDLFGGHEVVVDPGMALHLIRNVKDPCRSVWVYRYYDLGDREFPKYGETLVHLIAFIRALCTDGEGVQPKVNIIAHSMGGLIVREAIQRIYPSARDVDEAINKVVTLGTPHKGITFQILRDLNWLGIEAGPELEKFNPENQRHPENETSYLRLHERFPLERMLCVVGTNHRSYSVGISSLANRLFPVSGEFGTNYNRSDGLVKQDHAQIEGAPRTFVHKCHGGDDSLMTARESFEVATRFLFGDLRMRLHLVAGRIKRGFDRFGKSEFFFGVSIKPRGVDFELFHQSREAENCYGPFHQPDLADATPAFGWAGPDRLIWEGFLAKAAANLRPDVVMRAEFYLGERDLLGIGFSDNVILHRQIYIQAVERDGQPIELRLHENEDFQLEAADAPRSGTPLQKVDRGWEFAIANPGFDGTFRVEIDVIDEVGRPRPWNG